MGERALCALARPTAECSVVLVDDAAMAELNHAYRGVTGPTDVLAFPMNEGRFRATWPSSRALRQAQSPELRGTRGRGTQVEGPDLLGDVVISAETAARQARHAAGGLRGELALLLVHGILHLVGYDHGPAAERRRMGQTQRIILEASGLRLEACGFHTAAARATPTARATPAAREGRRRPARSGRRKV